MFSLAYLDAAARPRGRTLQSAVQPDAAPAAGSTMVESEPARPAARWGPSDSCRALTPAWSGSLVGTAGSAAIPGGRPFQIEGVVGRRPSRTWAWCLAGLARLAPAAVPLGALALWLASLPHVPVEHMTDVGLVSVLPVQVFIALGLVTAGFCLTLARPRLSTGLLLLHVLVLILMLHGVAALVEPEPRFTTAWLHAGITDYIMRHGQVDPTLDARYNWPAFFAFGHTAPGGATTPHPPWQ